MRHRFVCSIFALLLVIYVPTSHTSTDKLLNATIVCGAFYYLHSLYYVEVGRLGLAEQYRKMDKTTMGFAELIKMHTNDVFDIEVVRVEALLGLFGIMEHKIEHIDGIKDYRKMCDEILVGALRYSGVKNK